MKSKKEIETECNILLIQFNKYFLQIFSLFLFISSYTTIQAADFCKLLDNMTDKLDSHDAAMKEKTFDNVIGKSSLFKKSNNNISWKKHFPDSTALKNCLDKIATLSDSNFKASPCGSLIQPKVFQDFNKGVDPKWSYFSDPNQHAAIAKILPSDSIRQLVKTRLTSSRPSNVGEMHDIEVELTSDLIKKITGSLNGKIKCGKIVKGGDGKISSQDMPTATKVTIKIEVQANGETSIISMFPSI